MGGKNESSDDSKGSKNRDIRFSFDYIEDIKMVDADKKLDLASSTTTPAANKSWIKNNTNLKINSDKTYSSVYRSA